MKVLKIIIAILGLSFLASCSNTEDPRGGVQKYSITFDTDGGSLVLAQEVEWGECATKPGDPAKTGYTFLGWYTDDDLYYFSQAVTQDISLKAKWRANSYKIAFDKNGAIDNVSSMSKLSCTYDEEYSLPENTFTSTGSTFLGWGTDKNGEPCYSDCETIKNLSSVNGDTITLYAIWSKNLYHKIIYENLHNSENASDNPRKFLENQTIVILPPSNRVGYTFDGWYTDSDFSGNAVSGWISGSYTTDITLYAKWNPFVYKVTLNDRGTSVELDVPFGECIPTYTVSESDSIPFGGFYTEPYGRGTQFINSAGIGNREITEPKDLTLYAFWEYKITYVIDNPENIGYVNPNPSSYTGERAIVFSDLTLRPGYKFYGWEDENGQIIKRIAKGSSGSREIKSRGISIIVYTITYNRNGGAWDTTSSYSPPEYFSIESDEISLPSEENIKRSGHIFEGWYATADFSGEKITSVPKGTFENLNFYAKWITE